MSNITDFTRSLGAIVLYAFRLSIAGHVIYLLMQGSQDFWINKKALAYSKRHGEVPASFTFPLFRVLLNCRGSQPRAPM